MRLVRKTIRLAIKKEALATAQEIKQRIDALQPGISKNDAAVKVCSEDNQKIDQAIRSKLQAVIPKAKLVRNSKHI